MAEAEVKTVIPITKFYVSDKTRADIFNTLNANGGIAHAANAISTLEETGKLPKDLPVSMGQGGTGYNDYAATVEKDIKPFREGALSDFNTMKTNIANLDLAGLNQLRGLAEAINMEGVDFEEQQAGKVAKFKEDFKNQLSKKVDDPGLVSQLADKAAQRFVIERKTGEQSIVEFVAQEGNLDPNIVREGIGNIFSGSEGMYITPGKGDFGNDLTDINDLIARKTDEVKEEGRQKQQQQLAEGQRGQSAQLFQQALQAFQQPLPTFTPEFNEAALGKLQTDILKQGQSAVSNRE